MGRTDRAALLVHVERDVVFTALTDEEALLAWLPPSGMHGRFEHFDMTSGGSYTLVLTYDDGSGSPGKTTADSDVSEVGVVRIDEGERILQEVAFVSDDPAFAGTTRMEWRLSAVDGGTLVEIIASDVPAGIRARDHAEGIASSLVNLARYLEP